MERVNLALLNNALTTTGEQLQRRLPDEELAQLAVLVTQMADRYPSQDLEQSIEGYLADFEQLAMLYGLRKVYEALAALRIRPGQKFFPRPDEVAEEIEHQRERKLVPGLAETRRRVEAEKAEGARLLTDPEEIAWRRSKFGYDPWTEKKPAEKGAAA